MSGEVCSHINSCFHIIKYEDCETEIRAYDSDKEMRC